MLLEPVEFSHGGDVVEGSSITFYAPKPNQRKKTTKLKQAFFRSLPTEGEATGEKPEELEISGTEVLFLIASSKEADYTEFIEIGRSLVCDKVGKVDDVENFTTFIADKLDIDVLENIIGDYVANFIVRSSLKSLMKV
jgi:hypothetical protein